MIDIESLARQVAGLHQGDLQRWIDNDWVRPAGSSGAYVFHDVDIARVRLIHELRETLRVDEEALPLVLLLLDQIYDLRRRMRQLSAAIEVSTTEEVKLALIRHLTTPQAG